MNPSIISLCETWLNVDILDNEMSLPGYGPPYRCDRIGRRGGGVCVYVREGLSAIELCVNDKPTCIESLWLDIPKYNFILLTLYIPPGLIKSQHRNITNYILKGCEDYLDVTNCRRLMITGDINDFPCDTLSNTLGLYQMVTFPTRGSATLDQIFLDANLAKSYCPPILCPNVGKSDHRSILLKPICGQHRKSSVHKVYDLRQSNVDKVFHIISSYSWTQFYRSEKTLQEKCDIFYSIIYEAISTLPFTLVEMDDRDRPWMTPKLKNLINLRYEAYRSRNFSLYNHIKKKVRSEIFNAKREWKYSLCNSKRGLWKAANSLTGRKSSSASALSRIINKFQSEQIAAESINDAFSDNFSPKSDFPCLNDALSHREEVWNPVIDVISTWRLLKSINTRKAAGSDGIMPRIIRDCAEALAPPLTHLFALSVETKELPKQWKLANVIPIPKPKASTIKDLRPISLLPIMVKVFEKIVLASVKDEILNSYDDEQFGFRPRCSTLHAQIKIHDFITTELDRNEVNGVVLISLDLSKAFDTLKHSCLIKTLQAGKLPLGFVQWCAGYLRNRHQRVVINQAIMSSVIDVPSGVPQGSLLSPFLFSLHMSSLAPFAATSRIVKYADDIYITFPINNLTDVSLAITNEISHVKDWCKNHGLVLNEEKTKIMVVSKRQRSITPILPIDSLSYEDFTNFLPKRN